MPRALKQCAHWAAVQLEQHKLVHHHPPIPGARSTKALMQGPPMASSMKRGDFYCTKASMWRSASMAITPHTVALHTLLTYGGSIPCRSCWACKCRLDGASKLQI